jgi:hypothetical protein
MSKNEIINLHLQPNHSKNLSKGLNVQLSKEQLHDAIVKDANSELHMLRKHVTQIINSHKSGKGIRLTQDKISGGKFNFE